MCFWQGCEAGTQSVLQCRRQSRAVTGRAELYFCNLHAVLHATARSNIGEEHALALPAGHDVRLGGWCAASEGGWPYLKATSSCCLCLGGSEVAWFAARTCLSGLVTRPDGTETKRCKEAGLSRAKPASCTPCQKSYLCHKQHCSLEATGSRRYRAQCLSESSPPGQGAHEWSFALRAAGLQIWSLGKSDVRTFASEPRHLTSPSCTFLRVRFVLVVNCRSKAAVTRASGAVGCPS